MGQSRPDQRDLDGDESVISPRNSDSSLLATERGTNRTRRLETDADNNLCVNVVEGQIDVTVGEVEVKNDSGNPVPVSGTVAVSNFPATQNVAVTSSVEIEVKNDSGNPVPVSGTVTANAGTGPFPVSDNSGSLTVDGTVAATQSGTWQDVPNRPSQGTGRTYKHGVASAITGDTTVYTVTNGKKLYVTNIDLSAFNTSTTNAGRIDIRDNTTIVQTVSMSAAGVGALATAVPANVSSIVFPEPLQFSTDVNLDIVAGTITCSFCFTGYEE